MFEVDIKVATMSNTIKTMLETLSLDDPDNMIPIPLPNANSVMLAKVVEWGNYHMDNPVKLTSDDEDDEMDPHKERAYNPSEFDREYKIEFCEWDRKFFEVDTLSILVKVFCKQFHKILNFKHFMVF